MTPEQKAQLKALEESFCEAAVKLRKLQKEIGINPGAKVHVTAMTRGYPEGDGVVANFGDAWRDADAMTVPVVFSDGRMGLYSASRLTARSK